MKTLFYSLTTFILLCICSAQLKAQGVFSNVYLYPYSIGCGQYSFGINSTICSLATGSIITATLDFGDGSLPSVTTYTTNSVPCDSIYTSITHTYTVAGSFTPTITFSAPSTTSATQSVNVTASTCDVISGYAYIDANTDCIKNVGEAIQPNVYVVLKANGVQVGNTVTDATGYYEFNYVYASGTVYTVEILNCASSISCTGGNVITASAPTMTNANFGFNGSIVNPFLVIPSVTSSASGNCNNYITFEMHASANNLAGQVCNFTIDYGDGSTGTVASSISNFATLCSLDSAATAFSSHIYAAAGIYTVVVTATSGATSAIPYTYIITVAPSTCLHYEGYVYADANTNCIFDAGESAMVTEAIKLLDNGVYVNSAYTNVSGFYEFNQAFIVGHTYTIERFNAIPAPSCATNTSYTLTASTGTNLNFGLSTATSAYIQDSISNFYSCGLLKIFSPQVSGYFLNATTIYTLNIDFGDGTTYSQTSNTFSYTNGNFSILNITSFNHTYATGNTYTVTYALLDNSGIIATDTNVITAAPCGNYSGNVYIDGNANCIKNAGEQDFTNGYVYIKLGTSNVGFGWLDNLGNYSVDFPFISGQTYIIEFVANNWGTTNCYVVTCPSTLTYASTLQNATNLNFAVEQNTTSFDLYAGYMNPMGTNPGGFNSGNTYTCYFFYGNQLCGNANGSVSITIDPNVTFVSSTTPGYTVSGNVVTWPAALVNNWNVIYFDINVPLLKVNSSPFLIGDTVCLSATINPSAVGDANLANNTYSNCYIIGTAYDPNDKQVFPKGKSTEGIVAQNQTLEYTIRFQNTGTAPAQNIIVRDTIDANLDISTMEILASSHFMNTTKVGKAIAFTFPNIMLPDSNTDKEGSNGFVRFTIKPNLGLPIATKVKNIASIYFDVNPAIVTNVVKNQLGTIPDAISKLNTANHIWVTPNPANQHIQLEIRNDELKDATIAIYNAMGQVVMQLLIENKNQKIDISKLANGVYTMQVKQSNQQQILKFIKD